MFSSVKRRVALAAAAAALCVVASAIASGSASAYNFYPSSTSTVPWPQGTAYTATASPFALTNASGSTTYLRCTSSTVSGATTGVNSTGHNVGGGSFSGCGIAGTAVAVAPCPGPWQFTPTSGAAPGPFAATITNVCVSVTCGSSTAHLTGTLSSGVTWIDSNSPPSALKLTGAGTLMKSGSGCGVPPVNVAVTATYTTATVNGSPASATNNLWLK